MMSRLARLALLALLLARPDRALAEEEEKKTGEEKTKVDEKAFELYQEGIKLAKEGKYEEAIKAFEEARMRGAPDETLFNLGKCYEGLGLFHVAVDYYGQFVESPSAKEVERVKEIMEELKLKPSQLTFKSNPPGAEVRQVLPDGTESKMGITPFEFTAPAGEFTFIIVKKGFKNKEMTITTGYGKPYDLEIDLTTDVVQVEVIDKSKTIEDVTGPSSATEEPVEPPKQERPHPRFPKVGVTAEIGTGVALYPMKNVDFQAGGIFTFGVGYRLSKGPDSGFAVGLRFDLRSYKLEGTNEAGESREWSAFLLHILAVPSYQFRVHPRLAVEASLPLGVAILSLADTVPASAWIDLVDGHISGGNLPMFELGVGAALRIMIVSGLYATVEPVRLRLLLPSKWGQDAGKALVNLDITARIGFQF